MASHKGIDGQGDNRDWARFQWKGTPRDVIPFQTVKVSEFSNWFSASLLVYRGLINWCPGRRSWKESPVESQRTSYNCTKIIHLFVETWRNGAIELRNFNIVIYTWIYNMNFLLNIMYNHMLRVDPYVMYSSHPYILNGQLMR